MPGSPEQFKPREEQEKQHFERSVAVDEEHLGIEIDEVSLDKINTHFYQGIGEVYFRTASGNIYLIKKMATSEKESLMGKDWSIINGRENEGWEKGQKIKGAFLSEKDLRSGVLKIGEPFTYGNGGGTGEVSEIVLVDEKTSHSNPNNLKKITNGMTSDIIKDFEKILHSPEK